MPRREPWKPNIETAWVALRTIGFGVWVYALFVEDWPCPIGIVWGLAQGKSFRVYHSYVIPEARRHGVRSKINQEIHKTFNVITTGTSSTKDGKAFMKSQGYIRRPEAGEMYLRRKK
jgi:GNAT superfamily N-acetyltransferase